MEKTNNLEPFHLTSVKGALYPKSKSMKERGGDQIRRPRKESFHLTSVEGAQSYPISKSMEGGDDQIRRPRKEPFHLTSVEGAQSYPISESMEEGGDQVRRPRKEPFHLTSVEGAQSYPISKSMEGGGDQVRRPRKSRVTKSYKFDINGLYESLYSLDRKLRIFKSYSSIIKNREDLKCALGIPLLFQDKFERYVPYWEIDSWKEGELEDFIMRAEDIYTVYDFTICEEKNHARLVADMYYNNEPVFVIVNYRMSKYGGNITISKILKRPKICF